MTRDQVEAVVDAALREGLGEATMSRLRERFKGIHLTYCRDDDVNGVAPFLRYPQLNVYLVDGRSHCLALSEVLEAATGLVLAEVDEDEDEGEA